MSNGVKRVRERLNSHATRRESERESEREKVFVCGCACGCVCGCVGVCGCVCMIYSTHVRKYTSDSLTVQTLSVNISKLGEPSDYDIFFSA
jgi:hypothetical protein